MKRQWVLGACSFLVTVAAWGGGIPSNSQSSGTGPFGPVLTMAGANRSLARGDVVGSGTFVSGGFEGFDDAYEIFVEVPPGTTNLTIEVFDADHGQPGEAVESPNFMDFDDIAGGSNDFESGTITYELFTPTGSPQGTIFDAGDVEDNPDRLSNNGLIGGSDPDACSPAHNRWCPLVSITSPTSGHWRIVINTNGTAGTNGTNNDFSAFGIRACSLTSGSDCGTGTVQRDLLVYAENILDIGHAIDGSLDQETTLYPYMTQGCQVRVTDFDADNAGSYQITSRRGPTAGVTQTRVAGDLSDSNLFQDQPLVDFTTRGAPADELFRVDDYGIWSLLFDSDDSGSMANIVPIYVGNELLNAATIGTGADNLGDPPTDQFPRLNPIQNSASGSSFGGSVTYPIRATRLYFPPLTYAPPTPQTQAAAAAVAPLKPYMQQIVLAYDDADGTPTEPTLATPGEAVIRVRFYNPTAFPVTFGTTANDIVRVRVPGGDVGFDAVLSATGSITNTPTVSSPPAATVTEINWNPGSVAANSFAELRYRLNVTPGTPGDIILTGTAVTDGTIAVYDDETGTEHIFGPLCELFARTDTATTIPVTLSQVQANRAGDMLDVQFATASSVGTLGFRIYGAASESAQPALLSNEVFGSDTPDALVEQRHQARVAGNADFIWIEELSAGGLTQRFGPFKVGDSYGSRGNLASPIRWSDIKRGLDQAHAARQGSLRNAGGDVVQISVAARGEQRVRYEELVAAGTNLAGLGAEQLQLTEGERVIPLRIEGGAVLAPGTELRFYVEPAENRYATASRLLLREGNGEALTRTAATPGPQAGWTDLFMRVEDNANREYLLATPAPDPWIARSITRRNANAERVEMVLNVPNLVAGSAGDLTIDAYGGLNYEGETPDHHLAIEVNGVALHQDAFDGTNRLFRQLQVPAGVLRSGANQVALTLLPTTGYATDRVNIESIAIGAPQQLVLVNGELAFRGAEGSDGAIAVRERLFAGGFEATPSASCASGVDAGCQTYTIDGFASPAGSAFQIRDGAVTELVGGRFSATARGYALTFSALENHLDSYYVADATRTRAPLVEAAPAPVDLYRDGRVDLAIIAHPSLIDGLDRLVNARRAEGLEVALIDVEQLYHAYARGQIDPEAIKRYIREAHARQGLRYVLLVGGDTYDYHDNLGLGSVSLIPTLYGQTSGYVYHAPVDAAFGDVDADQVPDVAVGRFPVRTNAELQAMIDKTLSFDQGSNRDALWVADRDSGATTFVATLATLSQQLTGFHSTTLNLADFANADVARAELASQVNSGTRVVGYFGHGSPSNWTFSGLLTAAQVSAGLFTNSTDHPLLLQWGCWGGYFVQPQYNGMAHAWLLGSTGAAATIGSTGLADAVVEEMLAAELLSALDDSVRVGDALLHAQQQLGVNRPHDKTTALGAVLLGDPTLKLR